MSSSVRARLHGFVSRHLLRKTETTNVTPVKPVLSRVEGAGSRFKKLDSRFRGNDKLSFRNRRKLELKGQLE